MRAVLIAAVLLLPLLGGCDPKLPNPEFEGPDPLVMRVFQVAPEKAREIRVALADVLVDPEAKRSYGRVSQLADGRLVVLAPITLQSSIAATLEKLGAQAGTGTVVPETSVRMSLWIVDTDPAASADDPALAPLAGALDAARSTLGETRFVLHDAVVLTSTLEGQAAIARTARDTAVESRLRPARDGARAELRVHGGERAQLETVATLPFGKTLVLARLAAGEPDARGTIERTRLYVVRADRAED